MTNTMTPSEIADWLEKRGALFDEEAATTIRAQAEALKIAESDRDVARNDCDMLVERMKRYEYEIKIATEALEKVKVTAKVGGSHSTEGYAHDECIDLAAQALARIKEAA